jgi:cation transport ATPase
MSGPAAQLAAEVGITDVRAGLLPEDTLDVVTALPADGHRVLRVGDGVNDASALTAVIRLARWAYRVVRANLAFAAAVIVGLVTWDIAGALPLPLVWPGTRDRPSSSGLTGLRLLRKAVWSRAHRSGRCCLSRLEGRTQRSSRSRPRYR